MNLQTSFLFTLTAASLCAGSMALSPASEPVRIKARVAASGIPNFPNLEPSQGDSDVIYFPQNPSTANAYNMANMLCLVNRLRTGHGLHPVVYHESLLTLAVRHASFQARYRVITHADSGGQIGERVTALGFDWALLLENVGGGADNEYAIMDAWSKSPGHLANILNPSIRFIGVHVTNGFWVQDFAAPMDPTYVPPLSRIDACPSPNNLYIYS
ncbi:hypothetical protein DL89DRAFT_280518 [Linderina pennispora]|uniref:SCP domain-containing protein n=1 Tax=Linderina pennispora TaxID=61395 RepID=A0A1Y1WL34_9FUNG|nr:uncharacterized protein DL89DRAFT_280518 [Linderina pennispora]ORX74018.1 hypothetical protein DL89DRAFT_280518 [Linderina pennispora]